MYFFKIKYHYARTYRTLRCRDSISFIFQFLLSIPFCSLNRIEKITIERINK